MSVGKCEIGANVAIVLGDAALARNVNASPSRKNQVTSNKLGATWALEESSAGHYVMDLLIVEGQHEETGDEIRCQR